MTKRSKQLFFSQNYMPRLEHGGSIRRGKRKLARPIDPKRPMHLVMRAEVARNKLSLMRHARAIDELGAFGKFWDALAYTRIAEWGRAFRILRDYLSINAMEVAGIFEARKRPTTRDSQYLRP